MAEINSTGVDSDTRELIFVNKIEFETKLFAHYEKHSANNHSGWNSKQEAIVIKVLQDAANPNFKRTHSHYHYSKRYDVKSINGKDRIIVKRTQVTDPIIICLPIEDYYDILYELHQRGHGGRDRMFQLCKSEGYKIMKEACGMFVSCCTICNKKKSAIKSGIVIKPILSEYYNKRAQVDLIDFQSIPDGNYKWLMVLQDHHTKFIHLRPLEKKLADHVAKELRIIFLYWGAPEILQSDNGREFDNCIVKDIMKVYKHSQIVHGRPRHPQSQGSVERANGDVKNMLRAWILEKQIANWSESCHDIAWFKNTLRHRILGNITPYEAVLGEIRSPLPNFIRKNLLTEEDREKAIAELNAGLEENGAADPETIITYEEMYEELASKSLLSETETAAHSPEIPGIVEVSGQNNPSDAIDILQAGSEETLLAGDVVIKEAVTSLGFNANDASIVDGDFSLEPHLVEVNRKPHDCGICQSPMTEARKCSNCILTIHPTCGEPNAVDGTIYCLLCIRKKRRAKTQSTCFKRQKIAADKMVTTTVNKILPLCVGDTIRTGE